MSELQAIIEFSIELHKFVNIDLFQRGYYQLRVAHKISSKIVHKIEINLTESSTQRNGIQQSYSNGSTVGGNGGNAVPVSSSVVFPPCIVNGAAVSKTFQILYKNEEVALNDVISIKTHLLVDAARCIEQIRKTSFIVDIELWFTEREFGPDHHNSIECVASRELVLHFDVCRGLHYHLPVMFDYFHLSAITISVHGSLITLCQPYLKKTKGKGPITTTGSKENDSYSSSEYTGYDTLLFGCPLSVLSANESKEVLNLRLRRAQLVHWQLCSVLLTAIQSLRRKLSEYIHLLPPLLQVASKMQVDVNPTISNLSPLAQQCYRSCLDMETAKPANFDFITFQNTSDLSKEYEPEDYITTVESDMAYLCGSAIVQWQQFLKVVLHSEKIVQHLSKSHHLQRIKRFSEAFFVVERPRNQLYSVCDNSSVLFNEMTETLKKSQYLLLLPRCDVECTALDGDITSLPIIYEEKYDQEVVSFLNSGNSSFASLSDISISEQFSSLALANCSSSESNASFSVTKRNLKEKLLTRLNFSSPNRNKGDEYSPSSSKNHHQRSASVERRKSLPLNSSLNSFHKEINDVVTLLSFKKVESIAASLRKQEKINKYHLHGTASMNDIKNHSKKMTVSESLPDLSLAMKQPQISGKKKLNPLKPPRQFRDLGDKRLKDGQGSLAAPSSIPEEEFEGTAYFPKPPAEFTADEKREKIALNNVDNKSAQAVVCGSGEEVTASSAVSEEASPAGPPSSSSSSESNESRKALRSTEKCTILEMLKHENCLMCGEEECSCGINEEEGEHSSASSLRKISAIGSELVNFVQAKENFRRLTAHKARGWNIYSDFSKLASRVPYFQCDVDLRAFCPQGLHMVVCVHGLDGNSADLRLVKTYLELGLPTINFEFLMSQRNQGETFDSFETLTDRLVQEITNHIVVYRLKPNRISFIGHSLGNIIVRAALARPEMAHLLPKLHTFLSLSGPHLGTAYNSSGLVNMGLWFMQKWKKSTSLLQLAMKDCGQDPRQSFLYKLSLEPGLEHFRYILLAGSSQDHYVPIHSAHMELCNSALNDTSINGIAYREMVANLLHPLMGKASVKLIRYDVHHALSSNANSLIGRAAHIAVLDSELFIEKFMVVCGLKYFA